MGQLEDDLDHDEDDDEPLEPHVVLVREVLADEAHQLWAVGQLLVHDPGALGQGQVLRGGVVQTLQAVAVPVEVGGVGQVRAGSEIRGLI